MKSGKNIKKISLLLACATVLSVGVVGLAACDNETDPVLSIKPLAIPTGVTVNYGDDEYSSEDDTVTFSAVENATQYFVYVYKEGDTKAKVTSGMGTTVELPTPLDAGDYKISVVAVGDGVNYSNSNGSEAVAYSLKKATVTKLGSVSDIKADFTSNKLTFKGVTGANQYSVAIYNSDASGAKSGDPILSLTVPAGDSTAVSYDIPVTAQETLLPGYYVFGIKAQSNSEYYTDGDTVEAPIVNGGHTYAVPEIEVTEPENGGILLTLTNNDSYISGTSFTVNVYDNEQATGDPIKTTTLNYTQSTDMFGNTSTKNTAALEVKESDGDLVVGGTYYIKLILAGDGTIYTNTVESEVKSITATKAGKGSTDSGNPGGPGGGGGGEDFAISFGTYTYTVGEESFQMKLGDHALLSFTATLQDTATEGSTYSFTCNTNDAGAPFTIVSTLELKSDGTAEFHLDATGPLSETDKTGTWTVEEGVVTITFAA